MLQYLYDMKCDIHQQTATLRRTAFHFAVLRHKAACFHKLLTFGAKPDARDTFGNTACHYAAEDGDVLLLDVLLRHQSVDPNAQVRILLMMLGIPPRAWS
jgi:ankyrin repeat protein